MFKSIRALILTVCDLPSIATLRHGQPLTQMSARPSLQERMERTKDSVDRFAKVDMHSFRFMWEDGPTASRVCTTADSVNSPQPGALPLDGWDQVHRPGGFGIAAGSGVVL